MKVEIRTLLVFLLISVFLMGIFLGMFLAYSLMFTQMENVVSNLKINNLNIEFNQSQFVNDLYNKFGSELKEKGEENDIFKN